jgi:hypothetical protein
MQDFRWFDITPFILNSFFYVLTIILKQTAPKFRSSFIESQCLLF